MSSMKAVFRLNHCPYLFLLRSISLSFSLSFDVLTRLTWTRDAVLGSSVFVVQTVLLNRTPYPPAKGTSERTKQKTVHSRIQYKEVVCIFASKWSAEKEEWTVACTCDWHYLLSFVIATEYESKWIACSSFHYEEDDSHRNQLNGVLAAAVQHTETRAIVWCKAHVHTV